MIGKSPNQNQLNLFKPVLKQFINPSHPLVLLAERIPWSELEKDFSPLYSNTGTPAKPIRLMIGLLLLKQMYNLGDETLMPEWVRDPYFQYFCGEVEFQWRPPCDPSDLVHFRKRIGTEGVEKLFKLSIDLHGETIKRQREVIVDTTVQEKNITFPTDVKLYCKIIGKCNKIAKTEGIVLRQSYRRTVKTLLLLQRFAHHPKRKKEADRSKRKLKTLAGRIVRDLERKFVEDQMQRYRQELLIFKAVIAQQRFDRDKIYSIHEPETSCIAKGKAHKQYEFGSKVSLAMLPKSNIIVGVLNFKGNPNDTITLKPTLDYAKKITGMKFDYAIVDRGYKVKRMIDETEIVIPGRKENSVYLQNRKRKKCRSRAAIEPIIGHIKSDCRMAKNYLKGRIGDEINSLMAATAFNFRKLLSKIEKDFILFIFNLTVKSSKPLNFSVILSY